MIRAPPPMLDPGRSFTLHWVTEFVPKVQYSVISEYEPIAVPALITLKSPIEASG
jgi:hypothetical protein